MLVHEATHGRLFDLRIPYNKRTRARCEQIGHREQVSFLKRALEWITGEPFQGNVESIMPFSQADCEQSWSTTLIQHFRGTCSRV